MEVARMVTRRSDSLNFKAARLIQAGEETFAGEVFDALCQLSI